MNSFLIGIAGGSGSGKTFLAKKVSEMFENKVLIIQQDSYYKDLSQLNFNERSLKNFDHPNAIDINLLKSHISKLLIGESIDKPTYNFSNHTREDKTKTLSPKPIIILEGILVLSFEELLKLFSLRVFIDVKPDLRFIRRLQRDIEKRNRNTIDVCKQYLSFVRPMHEKFVKPSKKSSDIIIKNDNNYKNLFNIIERVLAKSL
tara:strand:+ start:467 stop:1075 length:609 start_codon:yes stop_codon:yes gene_type:complete